LGRRTLKGVAGYDLTSLFVGSEGTLGIITRATLRLRPKPRPAATFVAFFPTLAAAGQAAAGIRRRVTPSLLELLDRFVLASVEEWRHLGLDTTSAAMLIGQSDSGGDEGHREVMSMRDCCELAGASFTAETTDALETDVFLAARKLALPSLGRRGLTLLDDVAVPCARVPDLIEAIETIAQRLGLSIAIYGHIGDGNMHPTIVLERDTTEMRHRAAQAFEGIARAALSLGGTIAGEHGTGLLKRDLLREELGDPLLELQRRLKAVFDPQNIMNAGKLA
jgi:glycolate oxidase